MSEPSPSDEDIEATVSPPARRPKREGNESLWKRARRTLGTNSLTFLQHQGRPTGVPSSGPAEPSKRREQVRQAQRTHRQRTQNYIKTLETEVVRLRKSEMKLMQDRDGLKGQVEILKFTIISSSIPLPAGINDPGHLTQPRPLSGLDMPATISYSADNLDHERLQVRWPESTIQAATSGFDQSYYDHGKLEPQSNQQVNIDKTLPDLPNDFSLQPLDLTTQMPSPNIPNPYASAAIANASPLDSSLEIAIDFILALEHPCIPHVPSSFSPSSNSPANHMMLASTPLFALAPDSPRINTSWTASGAIIKQLLNLSHSINLEGEITPVEAWQRLHQHPEFSRLDRGAIERLKGELSTVVRCCGFGAVLDEHVFWDSLDRLLSSIPTRHL